MLRSAHFKTPKTTINVCVLLLVISIFGCIKNKNGDEIVKHPVVMTFDKLEPVSGIQVFTRAGVQLDSLVYSQAIQNYLDRSYSLRTTTGAIFYQSKFLEPVAGDYGKSMFTVSNDGKIRYGVEIIDVKDLGDARILKSIVTNKIEDDPIITSALFKYKFDTNSNGTYNYQYVVHGDNRAIAVSLLYYKLVRYDDQGNLKSLAFGTVHNELNESFVKTLTRFDTLAVKAYRIRYSAK